MDSRELRTIRASVVYYLSRSGKVEPPHMIDVWHPSGQEMRLRDVKDRLTFLRGSGMPGMFSWSYKRSYKNSYIWQDVSDDDFVAPIRSGEYVLKGSEILDRNEEKVPKQAANYYVDYAKHPELLNRKYRGAETWLKVVDCAKPASEGKTGNNVLKKHAVLPQTNVNTFLRSKSYQDAKEQAKEEAVSSNSPPPNSVDSINENAQVQNLQKCTDIKVYKIRSPAIADDRVCNAATQTEEDKPVSSSLKKSSSSGANSKSKPVSSHISTSEDHSEQEEADANKITSKSKEVQSAEAKSIVNKKHTRGRLLLSRASDKDTHLNERMKNGGPPSWIFFHILSYCGGVETKVQGGLPPLTKQEQVSRQSSVKGSIFHSSSAEANLCVTPPNVVCSSTRKSDCLDHAMFVSKDTRISKISARVDVKDIFPSLCRQQAPRQEHL